MFYLKVGDNFCTASSTIVFHFWLLFSILHIFLLLQRPLGYLFLLSSNFCLSLAWPLSNRMNNVVLTLLISCLIRLTVWTINFQVRGGTFIETDELKIKRHVIEKQMMHFTVRVFIPYRDNEGQAVLQVLLDDTHLYFLNRLFLYASHISICSSTIFLDWSFFRFQLSLVKIVSMLSEVIG